MVEVEGSGVGIGWGPNFSDAEKGFVDIVFFLNRIHKSAFKALNMNILK